jgi:hypothetical protein
MGACWVALLVAVHGLAEAALLNPVFAMQQCPPDATVMTAAVSALEADYARLRAKAITGQELRAYDALAERLEQARNDWIRISQCQNLPDAEMFPLYDRLVALKEALAAGRANAEAERFEARVKAQGWPADVTNAVIQHKIRIGMTAAQVEMAWGEPERVHETVTAAGTREQWAYGSGTYLYFTDGKLTAIQRSR